MQQKITDQKKEHKLTVYPHKSPKKSHFQMSALQYLKRSVIKTLEFHLFAATPSNPATKETAIQSQNKNSINPSQVLASKPTT